MVRWQSLGKCPVVTMRNYHKDVVAYTGDMADFCSFKGYEPCHNSEEVIEHRI